MLIPLGILASSGGAGGSFELISTAYGTGSSGTVTFNVSGLGSTYKHLQLRVVQSNTFGTGQAAVLRFNSDTSTSYRGHVLRGDGSSVTSADYGARANIVVSTDTDSYSNHTVFICDILDPFSASKNKTVRSFAGGLVSTNQIRLYSGAWFSTSATTSLDLVSTNGSFTTTSRFSLYGIKR